MPKTWKSAELRLAKALGTERTGPTGRDDNDVKHPYLAVECKYRQKLPKWALDCLEQARTGKTAAGKLPIVVLLEKRMSLEDGIVVLRFADFMDLWRKSAPADDPIHTRGFSIQA